MVVAAGAILLTTSLQTADPSGLRLRIEPTRDEFKAGEPIECTVTLTNLSRDPVRVIRPDWFFVANTTPSPAVSFVIVRGDSRVARPIHGCLGDDIGDTGEKVSVVIGPSASLATTMKLPGCWAYTFDAAQSGPPGNAPVPTLPAGRYRVSARYGFPAGTYSRRWWAFLGSRNGDDGVTPAPPIQVEEPWHGEIVSNVVDLIVR
jgi:hypothetical protein